MSWDSSLEIGIEVIDNQHKELIAAVENSILTDSAQKGYDVFHSTMDFLESYVLQHFSDEESFQKYSNYPNYSVHKSLHEDLIQDLNEIKNQIDREGLNPKIIQAVNQFLLDWVIHHVSSADMQFGKYYRKWNSENMNQSSNIEREKVTT